MKQCEKQESMPHIKEPHVALNPDLTSETISVFEKRLLKSMLEALIKSTKLRQADLISGDVREGLRGPTPPFDGNAQNMKARLLRRKDKEGKGR